MTPNILSFVLRDRLRSISQEKRSFDQAMNYARAVKQLREARKLKQKELAERANLDASYVSQIESNKRIPSSATAEAIAKALDIPYYLFILFASDAEDLRGISEEKARQLEQNLLAIVLQGEEH